jgi:hypothetical protein
MAPAALRLTPSPWMSSGSVALRRTSKIEHEYRVPCAPFPLLAFIHQSEVHSQHRPTFCEVHVKEHVQKPAAMTAVYCLVGWVAALGWGMKQLTLATAGFETGRRVKARHGSSP